MGTSPVLRASTSVQAQVDERQASLSSLDPLFEAYQREYHIPGLAYGVVAEGRLVHVGAFGVQDIKTNAPVTPDTLFRIASMSKNFTALAAILVT